jgi:hypothetical protein
MIMLLRRFTISNTSLHLCYLNVQYLSVFLSGIGSHNLLNVKAVTIVDAVVIFGLHTAVLYYTNL